MISKSIQFYAALVLIWFLANQFFQDAWWGIVVLDKFAEYFLFASVPVFVLSVLCRRKFILLVATVPVIICGYFYMPFFTHLAADVTTSRSDHLRITTYNIWNHNKDIKAVSKIIKASDSDVVAIQEVTEDQRTELISVLSKHYPHYHVSEPIYGGTTGLFSRHPLENLLELNFDVDRPAIIAEVIWQGRRVTVVSAHLNPSFWAYHQQPWQQIPGNYHRYIKDQNKQADMIIDEVKNRTDSQATLLACDCNSQETASTNRLLKSYFKDTLRAVGWQLGSPSAPRLTFEHKINHIDYIWFNGLVTPVAIYRAKDSAGSDHKPVIADFLFSPR